jgi:hypothetical protein
MNTDHQMTSAAAPSSSVVPADAAVNAHSSQELDREHPARSSGNKDREGLRASQSFDESVRFDAGCRSIKKDSNKTKPGNELSTLEVAACMMCVYFAF